MKKIALTATVILLASLATVFSPQFSVRAVLPTTFSGTLFVSSPFSPPGGVIKVAFGYNSLSHTLSAGTPTVLVSGLSTGADGIVFGAGGDLLVGGCCCGSPGTSFSVVTSTTGSLVGTFGAAGIPSHHMMADVAGNAWTSSAGANCGGDSQVVSIPITNLPRATAHSIVGDDSFVDSLMWNSITRDESHAFYTSSLCCSGFGHFGVMDLSTTPFTTTCVKVSGSCEVFPAAHGGTFDPFTGDVIIFGDGHITQIDPNTLTVVSDFSASVCCFDQGTVDGFGHLFVGGTGPVFFLDYSTSRHVGDPTNFTTSISCGCSDADDIAPLIFPGSSGMQVSKFFTDTGLNPLPLDGLNNSMLNVVLARGVVRSTNPGRIIAWVNVTNNSGQPLQSLMVNDTLPVDWAVDPPWMPGVGAIHVFFENSSSLASNLEITQRSTITVIAGNPEVVQVAIPSLKNTAMGHPLLPGQSILLSVKLTYGLIKTSQSFASYPRSYTDMAIVVAWTQPSFGGVGFTGGGSAFFTAYAKVVGNPGGDTPIIGLPTCALV